MGTAFFIVPEREVQGLDPFVNGKALGHAQHLDRMAAEAGVRPILEFFSISPEEAAAAIEDLGGGVPVDGLEPETWFDAAEGLHTVRGMLRYLSENPTTRWATKVEPEAIARDLREFEAILSGLEEAGVRWHLAIDY
jgi:hypothetical protein